MHEYARFLRDGKIVARDDVLADDLTIRAANSRYGPAVWDLAQIGITGKGTPASGEDIRKLIVLAANFGSNDALYFLGQSFEYGTNGFAVNIDEARRMYLTCASDGFKECWFPAGRTLLVQEDRDDDDLTRGLAWLELAKEQGIEAARVFLEQQTALLTKVREKTVQSTKARLVHGFEP